MGPPLRGHFRHWQGGHVDPPLRMIGRAFPVRLRSARIVFNISAGTVQFIGFADDAFVIIVLPQSSGEWWPGVVFDGLDVRTGGHNAP